MKMLCVVDCDVQEEAALDDNVVTTFVNIAVDNI